MEPPPDSSGPSDDSARSRARSDPAHPTSTTGSGASSSDDLEATLQLQTEGVAPPNPTPDPSNAPSRWGSLELLERVGEGGFGETYRARDPRLDREVALKLLKADASVVDSFAGRVIREGALLARIRHPNVVMVYGAEHIEGRVGLWMEFVRGRTLEDLLATDGPWSARDAATIGIDVCRALTAVHAAGIVHSDIKTSNVMREDGGRIVLMDFGAGWDLTRPERGSGAVAGTALYMAPEVLRGEQPTVRSDIYSFGVLLYRLVSGDYPRVARSLEALLREDIARRPLVEARPGLPEPFVRVVERCLSRDPKDRYEGAGALEAALMSATVDLTAYRRDRIAEWSHPRYRLDLDFVALTLLIDQGEETAGGRWSARPNRYRDLRELLAAAEQPALVLLGPPGSGKSTLLRRLELEVAGAAIAGESEDRIPFFIQLNRFKAERPGGPLPSPAVWLAERWQTRYPDLPPLPSFWTEGRVLLLLDGLNEMPEEGTGSSKAVLLWKDFLQTLLLDHPGNQVVFSCRTLEYSAPLSTASLRVPQVVVEPMTDDQVEQFLTKHGGGTIWPHLKGTPQLEVMRSPYFLSLLMDQMHASGQIPKGRAELFTGFVRQALKREVERDNPLFLADGLLTERDVRRITHWSWGTSWELPDRGALIPKLSDLAFGMQSRSASGGSAQVRVDYQRALEILDHDRSEEIVKAGEALSVLDEDPSRDEVKFFHQLLQEYFAGRRFAASPEPGLVFTPWNAGEITPKLSEILPHLPVGESLPPLPTTGWEETALLAAAMTPDLEGFIRGIMSANLPLAGRCASQPEISPRLSGGLLSELRGALASRSRHRDADLRSRIEAGLALGPLGDPRFERRRGNHGPYLLPPMAEIGGGRYPVGEDERYEWFDDSWGDHMPRHEIPLAPYRIGRFPVTNAEWAHFMDAGGYEDERWWDTEDAKQWQRGVGTSDTLHSNVRHWFGVFSKDPEQIERRLATGNFTRETYERWMKRLSMSPEELERHIWEIYPGGKVREPDFWRDPAWNNPSQPVVGICWYEARAYANWLSVQAGEVYRLPTEVEWEAAARGQAGRRYATGDEFDPLRVNSSETRIRRTTPVGVFVEGDTPESVSDLTGNVEEWTISLYGAVSTNDESSFRYPYRTDDGREEPSAGKEVRRVVRGGGWPRDPVILRCANRMGNRPASRDNSTGFRLAAGPHIPPP